MYNVNIGKALSFLRDLNWVPKLQLESMDFHKDTKWLTECQQVFNLYFENRRINRRQANEMANTLLARVASS